MGRVRKSRERKGHQSKFPGKLMTILENAEAKAYDHIVAWCGDGSSFTVREKDLFIEQVAPAYFKLRHWRSFERQLNLWGFERLQKRHSMTFSHPVLRRGEPESLKRMKRSEGEKKEQARENLEVCCLPIESEGCEEKVYEEEEKGYIEDTDDDTEADEPPTHPLGRSTEANHGYMTSDDDYPIDHESDTLQLPADTTGEHEANDMEAFSSKKIDSEKQPVQHTCGAGTWDFRETVGIELLVGTDSWVLSDWETF